MCICEGNDVSDHGTQGFCHVYINTPPVIMSRVAETMIIFILLNEITHTGLRDEGDGRSGGLAGPVAAVGGISHETRTARPVPLQVQLPVPSMDVGCSTYIFQYSYIVNNTYAQDLDIKVGSQPVCISTLVYPLAGR